MPLKKQGRELRAQERTDFPFSVTSKKKIITINLVEQSSNLEGREQGYFLVVGSQGGMR